MPVTLPPLPYAADALAPHISARTLEVHYGRHHRAYVAKTLELASGTPFQDASLEQIIRRTAHDTARRALFNAAAQSWNHAFYWRSMSPGGGGSPSGAAAQQIASAFGGAEGFTAAWRAAAASRFGSGWVWLVLDNASLAVIHTGNAGTPLASGQTPLLAMDVWEHAYYLDYQDRRPDYTAAFLAHLLDWDFVNANLRAAARPPGPAAQDAA